ncbi:hypothetical protein L596_000336 [Steinernema carpocapsae]|uniref:Uncharacterized protein n=1 Tax=Steinernema carpocapsae TaxID=34508 RepID=A0A4U8UIG8_STECR|nr:hypothetical protein L596_000336 [Steinernema carpocapsae]
MIQSFYTTTFIFLTYKDAIKITYYLGVRGRRPETTDRQITFIGKTSITTILALIFTYQSYRGAGVHTLGCDLWRIRSVTTLTKKRQKCKHCKQFTTIVTLL